MGIRANITGPSQFNDDVHLRALLAALKYTYERNSMISLQQLLVALEVIRAERDGEPHTLVSLVKALGMPFSTASRVVWSLTEESGEDISVIRYVPHPTDRRKKLLVAASPRRFVKLVLKSMDRVVRKYCD